MTGQRLSESNEATLEPGSGWERPDTFAGRWEDHSLPAPGEPQEYPLCVVAICILLVVVLMTGGDSNGKDK